MGRNFQRRLGQRRELLADARLHAHADRLVACAQLGRAGGLEALVGAHVGEEFGEAALEPRRARCRLHARADARNLAEAKLVHLLGGERQRRVALDQIGIDLVAALHRRESHALAAALGR